MTCLGGKRSSKPKKWSKIFKILFITYLQGFKKYVCQTVDVRFNIVNKVVKQDLENDKDLGQICPKVSDIGPKGLH